MRDLPPTTTAKGFEPGFNVRNGSVWLVSVLLIFVTCGKALSATFDEQRKAVAASVETQSEEVILSLLKAGLEEQKPTQAFAEVQKWLRQNLPKDSMLLFHAARAAELSGDARSSAALYQQFLKEADPKTEYAGKAVISIHTLLRNQLNDPSAAYSFEKNTGNLVSANATARQFDQWFLGEAMRRMDAVAVAKRIHSVIQAGVSVELLQTHYSDELRWLLDQVDGYLDRGRSIPSNEEVASVYNGLAESLSFDEELKLKLKWAVAVRDYNLAKLADEDVPPPIAEAKALLEKYPENALWVQMGWAGGGNGPYYRGDTSKYWPHETEAKMAPIVAAAGKLDPFHLAMLMRSWRNGYYADKSTRPLQVEVVRNFVAADPKRTNSRNGLLLLETDWHKIEFAEAKNLAGKIVANNQEEVSLIRALVAGGEEKNFDKMVDALLGPEAWRVDPARMASLTDGLWHYAGRPGGNEKRDQRIKDARELEKKTKESMPKKDAPVAQYSARFKQLWGDYRSGNPRIPGVFNQLKAAAKLTPESVPSLIRDPSVEAQLLAHDTISSGFTIAEPVWTDLETNRGIRVNRYEPMALYHAGRNGGSFFELKRRAPSKALPHPLEPSLRQAVRDGLKKQDLPAWKVLAWINMQFPEGNEEQVKLIQELVKSPLWKEMPREVRFAAIKWFEKEAMSPGEIALLEAADPKLVAEGLFALAAEKTAEEEERKRQEEENKKNKIKPEPVDPDEEAAAAKMAAEEDVKRAKAALDAVLAGVREAPVRVVIPEGAMNGLTKLSPAVFSDPGILAVLLDLAEQPDVIGTPTDFGKRFLGVVKENGDPAVIHRAAPFLWNLVNRDHHNYGPITELAQSMVDTQPSVASALSRIGLDAFARHRGHSYFKRDVDVPMVKGIRGRAAMKMGLIVIPVPRADPSYPIYESQAEWLSGNEDSAGNLLDENWDQLAVVNRELSVPYLLWALQRSIYSREESRQETLVTALLDWAEQQGSPFSISEKIGLEIAYGDIAMQRGQIREAHEIYSRAQKNPAYQEFLEVHDATLRRVRAERIAKNFDGALQSLAQLELEKIPELWSPIRYARAEVYYDMEEFDDAADEIDSILARDPNHADAKIMLGKVQLKREKLMEATEVELGAAMDQESLVPGEKLKVTLTDPTLDVSGAGTEIEVVVWATSGDKEQFFLRRFGDQKTKFRGEVMTALGAPNPDDGKLQVIGDDEIYYAYSDRFRAKMNGLEEKRGGPILVASDAVLMASARKLLTEAEQRVADLEQLMDEITRGGARDATAEAAARMALAAEKLDAEARMESTGESEEEFQPYLVDVAKPGNPVYVRVIDPDRSRTAEIDELTVSVESSSGDSISRVTLKETGTHTGWFEGAITTTGAQAMAFARNSEPGRNPNMVISSTEGYPAWRPVPTKDFTPEFTVDLNDRIPLGEMQVTAAEDGAKLTKFVIQTAMNQRDWDTVAQYPMNRTIPKNPWEPSVLVMNDTDHHHVRNERSVFELTQSKDQRHPSLVQQVERAWMTQNHAQSWVSNVAGPTGGFPKSVIEDVKWKRGGHHDVSHVIYRFRAYFYEPEDVTRRFKVDLENYVIPATTHSSINHQPEFLLAINGRRITGEDGKLDGSLNLRAGVHRFEIWATGWVNNIGFGRGISLQANLEDPEKLVECPDSFFDPEAFPPGVLAHRNALAEIEASEDGSEFAVKFAPDSQARLIRIMVIENEGSVPAINKISLTEPGGKQVLPVAEDFAALNKNDVLEILADDKLSVRYIDDRFVTKSKQKHERFLDVRFTNARVEFADMEPRIGRSGELEPFYEKLLRFPHGELLSLAVHDADMDVSVEPDTVKVLVAVGNGEAKEYEAVETGDSTGTFRLDVTPVTGNSGVSNGEGEPKNPILVPEGETLVATYRDEETTQPGVSTDRVGTISHASFAKPELRLGHTHEVTLRESNEEEGQRAIWVQESKLIPVEEPPEDGFAVIHGRMVYLEVEAPHLALRKSSELKLFAQTDQGRRAAGAVAPGGENTGGFDISVPGTVDLTGRLGSMTLAELRTTGDSQEAREAARRLSRNYTGGGVWKGINVNDTERFRFSIPLIADVLPEVGYLTPEQRKARALELASSRFDDPSAIRMHGLVVTPGENVHFGFQYTEPDGTEKWITASAKVQTHPLFSIKDEDYRETVTSAYAGETLHLRVTDFGGDITDAPDTVRVLVQAKSGAKGYVQLQETEPHSGIFQGGCFLSYANEAGALPEDYDIRRQGFPVIYGDTVAARYTDGNGEKTETRMVTISKGADGRIEPFSKIYEDPEVAMKTQFSLAEAYLEMAKRHRKLGEVELAEQEYASAKQLLASAMDQFNDPNTRAHAEYLLGNLTLEEAIATEDEETRETRFRAALSRFMTVTGSYPDTLHASMAQFKIATIYEALKEPDIAAQEYVKLAYKYPDSEFLATAMARLGSHFLKKAAAYEAKAKPLLAKGEAEEDKDATFEGEAMQAMAVREYVKTAKIFERLRGRFPGNELAGQAGLRGGQAYLRAGKNKEALEAFLAVSNNEGYKSEERSASMYWAGMCYQNLREEMAAYSIFKRLTYDFPETEWAAYARGQLSQPGLLRLEQQLEIERLEAGAGG